MSGREPRIYGQARMARYIIRLEDNGEEFFLEWSADAGRPHGWGYAYPEFLTEYTRRYGIDAVANLSERLERVAKKGTSSRFLSLADLLAGNRAGADGTRFTAEQIIDWYCRRREEPTEEGAEAGDEDFDWESLW